MAETSPSPLTIETTMPGLGETAALRRSVAAQAEGFWRTQGEILDSVQALSAAWFGRRRAGAAAAQETVQTMFGAADPAAASLALQRWLAGSVERLTADGLDAQAHLFKLAEAWFGGMQGAASALDAATQPAPQRAEAGEAQRQPREAGRRAA